MGGEAISASTARHEQIRLAQAAAAQAEASSAAETHPEAGDDHARPAGPPAFCRARAERNFHAQMREQSVLHSVGRLIHDKAPSVDHALRALATFGESHVPRTHAGASHTYRNEAEARDAFRRQAAAFADPQRWNGLSGPENADFQLFDACGIQSHAHRFTEGDFLRVELPGGAPYAWVRVESVRVSADRIEVRVRPSYDPTRNPVDPRETAHFFDARATNTFVLERRGTTVRATVDGRDEYPNTHGQTDSGLEAVSNRGVTLGARAGNIDLPVVGHIPNAQQHQWDVFTSNVIAQGGSR
ncbi:MAG: hypothetical protein U0230_07745 [Polyangiales bacterium]